jgi:LPXTG-motif cell wall-anchored protein
VKYLRLALAGLIAAASVALLTQASPASAADANDPSYWAGVVEAETGHEAVCYKHDPPGSATPHGSLTQDGTGVVLAEFGADWPGDHWELLVVKSGSAGENGDGNAVYIHPQAGVAYYGPLNGGEQQGAVSHWIVCKGTGDPYQEPSSTAVTWKVSNGTCDNPLGKLRITFDPNAVTYTGDAAGDYAPGTTVTGSFTAKPGYEIDGNAGPFSHTFGVYGGPCSSDPNPSHEVECGAIVLSNVDLAPEGFVQEDAVFLIDGVEYIVAPGTTQTVTFDEDANGGQLDASVIYGDIDVTVTVDTDCDSNAIDPPSFSASYDCVTQTWTVELDPESDPNWTAGEPTFTGNRDYSIVITPVAGSHFAGHDPGPITLTASDTADEDCVLSQPQLTASYDCLAQQPSAELDPSDGNWDAGEFVFGNGTVSVTLTPNQGFRFLDAAPDGTLTLTAQFEVDDDCEETVTEPSYTPPTCDEPGSVELPENPRYTWRNNGDGTYTAVPRPGVRLVGTTTFGPYDTDQLTGEECVVPTIDVAAFAPVCQANTPFIRYEIRVSGTTVNVATLTFFDKNGNEVAKHVNVPLSGDVVYPGASIDPPDWPGWKFNENTKLWDVDPTDAILREGLTILVQVNPEATGQVTYPPATAVCDDPPPPQVQSNPPPTGSAQTPTTNPPSVRLPNTGSNSSGLLVAVAAMLLMGGTGLLLVVRRPRRV